MQVLLRGARKRRQTRNALDAFGHATITVRASDGALMWQAVAAYRACRPDVVTMDITMPEMDGIEATRLIMGEFPDAKIIMVTSHGQEKMVIDALKAGAKGYVLKPFDGHKVYEAIQKACKRVVLKDKLQSEIVHRAVEVPETEPVAKVSGE